MLECTKCWCISPQITQMESAGVGKIANSLCYHWIVKEQFTRKGALRRFQAEFLIAAFFFFLSLSLLVRTFYSVRLLERSNKHSARVHQVKHLPCEWTMTETPGWAFHTLWATAAGKTCTCGQQLCWQSRSHQRALLRLSLAENTHTHARTHAETRQEFLVSPDRCLLRRQSPSFLPLFCPSQPRSGDWERNERQGRRREERSEAIPSRPPSLLPRILYHLSTILNVKSWTCTNICQLN